jgi:hypothetical protein
MRLKTTSILALVGLFLLHSNFAAETPVPPSAGGEGIQSALDSLPAAGGEVVLTAGQYLIREPIILRRDNQTLRGSGNATVLYLADGANCPVVIVGSLTAASKKPTKGLRLANLCIDGNRKHQDKEIWQFLPAGAGVYNNGLDVWGTEDSTVEGVVCCHCRSGGLATSLGTRRLTVRDFTAFDNQFDGLACYQTEESRFCHMDLHDNLAAGISLDLNFNHNLIQNAVLTGDDLGIFMRQSCNNVFDAVTITQSHHHGVFMAETAVRTKLGWQLSPGSECISNTFLKLQVAHSGGNAFRVNDTGCNHNLIYDGQFVDNALGGLSEAAANLVTMRSGIEHAQVALPSKPSRLLTN